MTYVSTVLQGLEESELLYGTELPHEDYFEDSFDIGQKYDDWKKKKYARLSVEAAKAAVPITARMQTWFSGIVIGCTNPGLEKKRKIIQTVVLLCGEQNNTYGFKIVQANVQASNRSSQSSSHNST